MIKVQGLDEMINAFARLERLAAHEVAPKLDAIVSAAFAETEALAPVGTGDERRPAGSLRASGRFSTGLDWDDQWSASIEYGTEQDSGVPYAHWALVHGSDWLAEPTRAAEEQIERAILETFTPD